jgi:hypothetical protein
MENFISGTIVRASLDDVILNNKICMVIQPYNKVYIVAFIYTTSVDIKGNPLKVDKIIFKEICGENLTKITLDDRLSEEESRKIDYLKTNLLIEIRKRKFNKLGII